MNTDQLTGHVQLGLLRGSWPDLGPPINLSPDSADELVQFLKTVTDPSAARLLASLPLRHPGLRREAIRLLSLRPPGTVADMPSDRLGLAALLRRLLATASPSEAALLGRFITPREYTPSDPPEDVSRLTIGNWISLLPASERSQLNFVWHYALTESRTGERRNAAVGTPSAHPDLDWADWIRGRPLKLSYTLKLQRCSPRARLLGPDDLTQQTVALRGARLIRRSAQMSVRRRSHTSADHLRAATLPDQTTLRLLENTPDARQWPRGVWSHHVVNICLHLHSGVNDRNIEPDIFSALAWALIPEISAETDPDIHTLLRGGLQNLIINHHRRGASSTHADIYQALGKVPEPQIPDSEDAETGDTETGDDWAGDGYIRDGE